LPHPSSHHAVMISTLGSEAQVITAAYDLLYSQGEKIDRLQVLHTAAPCTAVAAAVERLRSDFHPRIPVEYIPILSETGAPLADIDSPGASRAFFQSVYQMVLAAKRSGRRVHLSIAGGRKTMTMFAMTAAQLLFDEHDHLWHLFSAGDFLASKRLHPAPGDDVHLLQVPVILWRQVTPAAWMLDEINDPFEAVERVRALQLIEKMEAARSFLRGALTPAELRVVELLVREALSHQEIADRLFLSPRTVEQHLRSAYSKAAAHWELDQVDRAQLIALTSLYFTLQITGKPA